MAEVAESISSTDTVEILQEVSYRPKVLALSSGGPKGIGIIGALQVLYDAKILDSIETYIGTSVGAVLSLLLVIGCSPAEIFILSIQSKILMPWREMYKIDRALLDKYGFAPHEKVTAKIRDVVLQKFGKIPTMKELYQATGKRLICVTTNETDVRADYLDYNNKPDLPCIDAMTASMLIPGLISKIKIDGKLCVDGAFVDPYPARYLDDGQTDILGIAVVGTEIDPESNFVSYLYAAMSITFDRLQELSMRGASPKIRSIVLRLPDISVLDTGKDINKRLRCYNAGVVNAMRALADIKGKSYEEYYGISVLPTQFTPVASYEIKRQTSRDRANGNLSTRFSRALGQIPVPRFHFGQPPS